MIIIQYAFVVLSRHSSSRYVCHKMKFSQILSAHVINIIMSLLDGLYCLVTQPQDILKVLFCQFYSCTSTFVLLNLTIIDSIFSYNKNSGLYFGKCISISFKGTTIFQGNTGYNGGAIVLDTDQHLIVDDTTQLIFTDNHAINHGRAIIYVLPNNNQLGFHYSNDHCTRANKMPF